MTWSVELRDKSGTVVLTAGLVLSPGYFSATALGGPDVAEILVAGGEEALWSVLDWLRYNVVIRNPKGNAVWWGIVVEAAVGLPAAALGRSLVDMANRVVVDYTVEEAGGNAERASTAWAQDNRSVASYGAKEQRLSLADATQTQAEALRTDALNKRGRPLATMALGGGSGARLVCHGLWRSLSWQLYANDTGRESHSVASDTEQMLGWALYGTTSCGFNGKRLDDVQARFAKVIPGNQIYISGSAGNDGIYTISGAGDSGETAISYTASTILFEPADDLQDNAHGLGFARMEHMLLISGAANGANNGSFWVTKEDSFRPELTPGQIVDEGAGAPITVKQGHALTVVEGFTRERTGPALNIYALASTIAQGFRLGTATGWTAKRVEVRVRKVGAPVDNLRVSIRANSGGAPGAELAAVAVAGSSISEGMGWVTFNLGAGVALSAGADYWLVVERTGAATANAFYVLGLESEATYPRGTLRIFNGAAWVARTPDAHMPFKLQDLVETTAQIGVIAGEGQFVTGVDVNVASGVYTNQWRGGDLTMRDELELLIESGTAAGTSITARVTPGGRVVVEQEAGSDDLRYMLDGAGELIDPVLGKAEEGQLPAGQWVGIAGVPSVLAETARFFVESAEYEVASRRLMLTPRAQG